MALVRITPGVVDLEVYAGDAWSLTYTIATLGDLTGSTIVAKFKNGDTGAVSDLTVTTSPSGLVASQFTVSQASGAAGSYDIKITVGGATRTYVSGSIATKADRA